METKNKEMKKNALTDIFYGNKPLCIFNKDDIEWLLQLAGEGKIYAIYCIIDGMGRPIMKAICRRWSPTTQSALSCMQKPIECNHCFTPSARHFHTSMSKCRRLNGENLSY